MNSPEYHLIWDDIKYLIDTENHLEAYEDLQNQAHRSADACGRDDSCAENARRLDGIVEQLQADHSVVWYYLFPNCGRKE